MTTVFYARSYGRFTHKKNNFKQKKLNRINQGFNFLRGSISDIDNLRTFITFGREKQSQHLKRCFFTSKKPSIFKSNKIKISFYSLEIFKSFPTTAYKASSEARFNFRG